MRLVVAAGAWFRSLRAEMDGEGGMSGGKSIESAVAAALVSDSAKGLLAEYVEAGLDAAIAEGVAKEVPVVNTIVGLTKIGLSIRDRLFAKKLLEMLADLSSMSSGERQELIVRLEGDENYGRRVGEHLTELLDRIDAHRKPKMVAQVFKAYATGTVDAVMLHRLCSAIERVPGFEVNRLRPFCEAPAENRDVPLDTLHNLLAAGLLHAASGWGGLVFEQSQTGQAFLQLELDRV